VEGKFPEYWITDGHCACNFVGKNGTSLHKEVISIFVEAIACDSVKRIEVRWYFGDNPGEPLKTNRMDIADFELANVNSNLSPNTLYKLNDPKHFQRQPPSA
jgi:hypothetical protein